MEAMYRVRLILTGLALILMNQVVVSQQLKLGNNPFTVQKSAVLDMESSNQGLLLVRISDTTSATSINSLSPPDGMIIYFTPANQLMVRSNGGWKPLTTLNGTGFVKASGTTISYDNSTYLTGNQSITLSGDVTGSGTTAITTTLANSGVTAGTYNGPYTVNAKGLVTTAANVTFNAPSRSLSTTGSNNTFTVSSTKASRVYYTINFSISTVLSGGNGQVDLDYSLDGGSNWVNVSSVSLVFNGTISTNMVLSGEIPPNALVRLNRSQNTNVTVSLTTRQQEVY